jgi:hypothetical protein
MSFGGRPDPLRLAEAGGIEVHDLIIVGVKRR